LFHHLLEIVAHARGQGDRLAHGAPHLRGHPWILTKTGLPRAYSNQNRPVGLELDLHVEGVAQTGFFSALMPLMYGTDRAGRSSGSLTACLMSKAYSPPPLWMPVREHSGIHGA